MKCVGSTTTLGSSSAVSPWCLQQTQTALRSSLNSTVLQGLTRCGRYTLFKYMLSTRPIRTSKMWQDKSLRVVTEMILSVEPEEDSAILGWGGCLGSSAAGQSLTSAKRSMAARRARLRSFGFHSNKRMCRETGKGAGEIISKHTTVNVRINVVHKKLNTVRSGIPHPDTGPHIPLGKEMRPEA